MTRESIAKALARHAEKSKSSIFVFRSFFLICSYRVINLLPMNAALAIPEALKDFAPHAFGESALASERRRGRGAITNRGGRFEAEQREALDDGWRSLDDLPPLRTEVTIEKPKTIIARNDSPDLNFDRSINPYRGCEHGCIYCFARPTHAYMGLSPGLDFETRLFAKPNAAELLRNEISAKGYKPAMIALGSNTDPYQPIEKTHRITRSVLEVLEEANHPVGIVTKSALVTRDIDILSRMAAKGLAKVAISVTTLDRRLARLMEPRAATPDKRLETIRQLTEAGITVTVLAAPMIPALNDHEIERILEACRKAGASEAGYVMLRLPLELKEVFREWLAENMPDRARHVLSLLRSTRGGKDYDAQFGKRMTGDGPYAWMIGRRFELASERYGYAKKRLRLRTDLFTPPAKARETAQLTLF
jgi:DNA repair photolyase